MGYEEDQKRQKAMREELERLRQEKAAFDARVDSTPIKQWGDLDVAQAWHMKQQDSFKARQEAIREKYGDNSQKR